MFRSTQTLVCLPNYLDFEWEGLSALALLHLHLAGCVTTLSLHHRRTVLLFLVARQNSMRTPTRFGMMVLSSWAIRCSSSLQKRHVTLVPRDVRVCTPAPKTNVACVPSGNKNLSSGSICVHRANAALLCRHLVSPDASVHSQALALEWHTRPSLHMYSAT